MNVKSLAFALLAVLIVVAGVFIGTQVAKSNYEYQGSLIEPPTTAYDFELEDAQGNTFSLNEQRGKVVLLFFGYTNCPDICPTTLADFKQIHTELGEGADKVIFVFITIDPKRDTPEKVGNYVTAFNLDFIGLSGTEEQLQPVWDGYYVYREISESNSAAGYLVDHSARVYVIDKWGDLRLTFPFGVQAEAMAADVAHLIAEESQQE